MLVIGSTQVGNRVNVDEGENSDSLTSFCHNFAPISPLIPDGNEAAMNNDEPVEAGLRLLLRASQLRTTNSSGVIQ